MQPAHMPTTAQAGSCCTPEPQAPPGRPQTPDTAKLLQRALASSSGSALLNSFSQEPSDFHPVRYVPAGSAKLNECERAVTAASAESAQQSSGGSVPVSGSEQREGVGSVAIPSSASGTAVIPSCLSSATLGDARSAANGLAASASAQIIGSRKGPGVVLAPLTNQEAVSQQQAREPTVNGQSGKQPAGRQVQPAGVEQQQKVSGSAGQQHAAGTQGKHEGQPRKALQTEGQVNLGQQAAPYQHISVGLNQAEGNHARALQQEGASGVGLGPSVADSSRHVTSQVQLSQARRSSTRLCLEDSMFKRQNTMLGMSCSHGSDFTLVNASGLMRMRSVIANICVYLRLGMHTGVWVHIVAYYQALHFLSYG